jgi:hypothetical protein
LDGLPPGVFRVTVKGDLIRSPQPDGVDRAVDGDHLPIYLAAGNGERTGDGVEGGTFESWFQTGD